MSKITRTKIQTMIYKTLQAPAYISQLIRHSRDCATYHDFPDRRLLLTKKLLSRQGLPVVKLVSLLEQELITFLEHASSTSGFSGVCVAQF